MREKGPRVAGVGAGVEVDVCAVEKGRDGVSGEENAAGGEAAEGSGKYVEEGLVAEAEVVDLVGDFRDRDPGFTAVFAEVDGEVDEGGFWAVVLPCCEEVTVGELGGAGVEGSWVVEVCWGDEDGDVSEDGGRYVPVVNEGDCCG